LTTGGTNPHALEEGAADLRQCDTLHAKVYIGRTQSVVCSANASINGLALEGTEQSGWIEAGTIVPTTPIISQWFEDLWGHITREIGADDWAERPSRNACVMRGWTIGFRCDSGGLRHQLWKGHVESDRPQTP